MDEINFIPKYSLEYDCTMLKVSEELLSACSTFDCGEADLNEFFEKDSLAYDKDLMGKTYCWLDNNDNTKIVCMVTVANAGIQTTHLQNNPRRKIDKLIAYNKHGRSYPAALIGRIGVSVGFQNPEYRIGKQMMDFLKEWFSGDDNKTGCRFLLVDALNSEHTLHYYERNGFKPLFPRVADEKEFYGIPENEDLRTRMYYFDLL